jgi:hypothetical protein
MRISKAEDVITSPWIPNNNAPLSRTVIESLYGGKMTATAWRAALARFLFTPAI